LLRQLQYDTIYNVENPFDWMEAISLDGKTNFFEARNSNYAKAGVMGKEGEEDFEMDDDDF